MLAGAVALGTVALAISAGGDDKPVVDERPLQSAQVGRMFEGIPQHGQTLGDRDAALTLYEFADLKCPICRAYSLAVLPTLVEKYVRPGKLKIVFLPQTFVGSPPGDSERAARFALAAGMQNKLREFTELWYHNQQHEHTAYATDDFIRWIASGVHGLDVDQAFADRDSAQVTRALERASKRFRSGGYPGTPGFALGRTAEPLRRLVATVYPEQFTVAIDRLLR
jgi:hypothetical protein